MTWQLVFTKSYISRAERFLRRHPELSERYFKTIELLEANPHHPSLRVHALRGRLAGLHSISISLSYRMTIEMAIREHEIVFINVGSHEDVYR